jgi:hypothetical protein
VSLVGTMTVQILVVGSLFFVCRWGIGNASFCLNDARV